MEDNIKLLKILLLEKKYPNFSDEELSTLLNSNENNVYATASKLCLMKADADKETKVGPITIKGPGAEYWINLSNQYANQANSNSENNVNNGGYKTRMNRVDDIC